MAALWRLRARRAEACCALAPVVMAVNLLAILPQKTITVDEFVHIPAGYAGISEGDFRPNDEHPPLAKLWAALPLLARGAHSPPDLPAQSSAQRTMNTARYVWEENAADFAVITFWARVPMIALTLALTIVLFSLEPTVQVHGWIVHTDIAAALAYLATWIALYAYLGRPTPPRAALLVIDLAQEGIAWFGGGWTTPIRVPVRVRSPGPSKGTPMTVSLRDVTKENWQACVQLKLAPEQEHFVASNAYSLAESKFMPTFIPQAIYRRDDATGAGALVGFAMYGYYPDGEPPFGQRHWIFRLMVDREHQGRGYGRAAMREILARLDADPACPNVLIGYEPDNTVARRLYLDLGFREIGPAPWGELVAERATP